MIVAVLYAFYRRFVLRPPRLERNREAILVLSLILAIMVTDFAFDGFRFALLPTACRRSRTNAPMRSAAARSPRRSPASARRHCRPATC